MCTWLALEVCCSGSTHSVPFTLQALSAIVLCNSAPDYTREYLVRGHRVYLAPVHCAQSCPNFEPEYIRCERIYWSKCDDCLRGEAAKIEDFSDDDLIIATEFNRLLRKELAKALHQRPYTELVRAFPTEFGIAQRFLLSGYRWVEAPQPTPTDALGPNPPLDTELEGLQWWYNVGMGGEVDNEIYRRFLSLNNPEDPDAQNVLNWMELFPSSPDQFSEVDNRTLTYVSSATSWEDRQSISESYVIRYMPPSEDEMEDEDEDEDDDDESSM